MAFASVAIASDVKAGGPPPGIVEQPIGRNVTDGGHVALSLSVTGAAPLVYQWWKGTQPLTNGTRISGVTNSVLNIDPVNTNDTGSYFAVVTNESGAITSAPVSVVVNQIAFQFTAVPGTGAWITFFGQVGDVYRIEVSVNFAPFATNGYATNLNGRVSYFDRDTGGGFRQLRFRLDRMLPVLYPAALPDVTPFAAKAAAPGFMRAYGKLNQVWRFEGSGNFVQWAPLGTVTNATGWVEFVDPDLSPGDLKRDIRFYRIAVP